MSPMHFHQVLTGQRLIKFFQGSILSFILSFSVYQQSNAEELSPTKSLENALNFTSSSPAKDQTPFQTFEAKIKALGYTLDSFPPEELANHSENANSLLELAIDKNIQELVDNHASINGYKKNSHASESERSQQIKKLENLNKILNGGLNDIKSQYPDKFRKAIEQIKFSSVTRTFITRGISVVHDEGGKTLSEIKETGLIKGSALADAFSKGALKGLIDDKLFITEEEYNERNNTEPIEEIAKPSDNKSAPPKNEKECATQSLDMFKEKIKRISVGDYVSFITEGAASPCRLIRLAYTVEQSPFKRRLKEGSFFDLNNKVTTLDQKRFDEILQSWGMLNGAVSVKANKIKGKSSATKGNRPSGKR